MQLYTSHTLRADRDDRGSRPSMADEVTLIGLEVCTVSINISIFIKLFCNNGYIACNTRKNSHLAIVASGARTYTVRFRQVIQATRRTTYNTCKRIVLNPTRTHYPGTDQTQNNYGRCPTCVHRTTYPTLLPCSQIHHRWLTTFTCCLRN